MPERFWAFRWDHVSSGSCGMRVSFISSGTRDGFVHRLDARTKMGVSLLGSIAVAVLNRPEPLGFLLGAALVYAWTVKRPKMPQTGDRLHR